MQLPEGLREIGRFAFFACENLTQIIIPTTVEKIGRGAFAGCAKLEKIYESMSAEGVQYLILSEPSAINYLTGRMIHPGERMMVFLLNAKERRAEFILSKLFPQEGEVGCPVTYFDDVDDWFANSEVFVNDGGKICHDEIAADKPFAVITAIIDASVF